MPHARTIYLADGQRIDLRDDEDIDICGCGCGAEFILPITKRRERLPEARIVRPTIRTSIMNVVAEAVIMAGAAALVASFVVWLVT